MIDSVNDSVGRRLAAVRKELGLSQRNFAISIGVSGGLVGQIEADHSLPSRAFLQKLSASHGVSSDWLLHGIGEMMQPVNHSGSDFVVQTENGTLHIEAKSYSEDFSLIPRMDLSVSAGSGLVAVDNEFSEALAFSATWLKRNTINAQLAVLVRVKGDSMSPAIPSGALVLVHMPEKTVEREGVYAFNRGEASFIKRLVPSAPDKNGRPTSIAILSDNPTYPPELLSGPALNELRIVGRVRCVMTTL